MTSTSIWYLLLADDTKEYVKIFTNIERLDQLQSYYVRCHKVSCVCRKTVQ